MAKERERTLFLRSQPKWQFLSRYGKVFDGNKLFKKAKVKNQRIDKYFYMTMAEIRNSLVWRDLQPCNKPKNWTYTNFPKTKFSKPHPNKYHFYKKHDPEYFLQEDPFKGTKKYGGVFSKQIGSII